jgi:hypothetical protein
MAYYGNFKKTRDDSNFYFFWVGIFKPIVLLINVNAHSTVCRHGVCFASGYASAQFVPKEFD